MKVIIVLACAALVAGKSVNPEAELPSALKICSLNQPNRDECIKSSIQQFLPALRQKIPNFDFPAIDPFSYDSVTFSFKNTDAISGTSTLRNVRTYGMSRGKVRSVKSDFNNGQMTIQAETFFPKLFASGAYNSNMSFNAFKIQSKGQYNITMRDVLAKWNIKGKLENINGEDYMKVHHFDILPEANDMKISVSGVFPDENLNRIANDFFNQNWRVLYKQMLPETRKQWEPIMLNIVNKIFLQIPFRRLLIQE